MTRGGVIKNTHEGSMEEGRRYYVRQKAEETTDERV